MKLKNIALSGATLLTLLNCKTLDINKDVYNKLEDGLYAQVKTTKGEMIVKFNEKEAPITVANFVGLAEGKIPNKAKKAGEPFYDGIVFHRIIKDFMIQGGDPQGTGMGDPGYKFDDEINDLKHTGKGILSMANSGPNTNGSQFFITEIATPWLDGKHTVFAKVVDGIPTVDALAATQTQNDKPVVPVSIQKVNIFSKGNEYKNYDAAKTFEEGKAKIKENNKAVMAKKEAEAQKQLESLKAGMEKTESGLYYKIVKKGNGPKPAKGDMVKVHYSGKLTNGTEFDSSFKRNQPIEINIGVGQVIKGWDEGILLLNEGDLATFLIPSDLGYGARGAGGVIPPNASLIFDVELVKVK